MVYRGLIQDNTVKSDVVNSSLMKYMYEENQIQILELFPF